MVRRQEALEAARRKMQAELDEKSAEFKEKQQRVSISLAFKEISQHSPPNVYTRDILIFFLLYLF